MTDRRGFFASLGAALLAPVLPLKEKWVFNRSHAIAYQAMGTLKCTESQFAEAIKLPLYNFPYNGDHICDINIPLLIGEVDDPFQTFQIDTSLKVDDFGFTTGDFGQSVSVGTYRDSSYVVDEVI